MDQSLHPSSLTFERAGGRRSGGSPAFSSDVMAEGVEIIEVIINAASGGSEDGEAARAVEAAFAACGVRARVTVARSGVDDVAELARRALSNGARAVVAGGGDGTVGS